MTLQLHKTRVYHCFLVMAILHPLLYFVYFGKSVIDIHHRAESIFTNEIFHYYLALSFLILIIWITYFISRSRLISNRLIWIHLILVFLCILFVPSLVLQFVDVRPGRYFDPGGFSLIRTFGIMVPSLFIE